MSRPSVLYGVENDHLIFKTKFMVIRESRTEISRESLGHHARSRHLGK